MRESSGKFINLIVFLGKISEIVNSGRKCNIMTVMVEKMRSVYEYFLTFKSSSRWPLKQY